jgi:hypothetical protein
MRNSRDCLIYFIPPRHPPIRRRSGEQFEIWAKQKPLDAAPCLLRLCAVLADGRHDDLVHVFGYPLRRAAHGE